MTSKADKPVTLRLQLTLSDTQGVMYDSTHEWNNLPLVGAVYVEQELLQLLNTMQQWGKTMATTGAIPEITWR